MQSFFGIAKKIRNVDFIPPTRRAAFAEAD